MAIYRHVHVEFWKDPKVLEELTPEDKLFFYISFDKSKYYSNWSL